MVRYGPSPHARALLLEVTQMKDIFDQRATGINFIAPKLEKKASISGIIVRVGHSGFYGTKGWI